MNIVNRCIKIINQYSEGNILIICDKGINRSIAIAISYAIIRCECTYENALNNIILAKNNISWSNLMNLRLCRLLENLKN